MVYLSQPLRCIGKQRALAEMEFKIHQTSHDLREEPMEWWHTLVSVPDSTRPSREQPF